LLYWASSACVSGPVGVFFMRASGQGQRGACYTRELNGGVAQLGERRVRNAKVRSSILLVSTTILPKPLPRNGFFFFRARLGQATVPFVQVPASKPAFHPDKAMFVSAEFVQACALPNDRATDTLSHPLGKTDTCLRGAAPP
jgi:hypothetical protein